MVQGCTLSPFLLNSLVIQHLNDVEVDGFWLKVGELPFEPKYMWTLIVLNGTLRCGDCSECLCRIVVVILNDGGGGSEVEGDANVKKKF